LQLRVKSLFSSSKLDNLHCQPIQSHSFFTIMLTIQVIVIILKSIQNCLGEIITLLEQQGTQTVPPTVGPTAQAEKSEGPSFSFGYQGALATPASSVTPAQSARDTTPAGNWTESYTDTLQTHCTHCSRPRLPYKDVCEYHQPRNKFPTIGFGGQGVQPGNSGGSC